MCTSLEDINAKVQSLENSSSHKVSVNSVEGIVDQAIADKLQTKVQKMVQEGLDKLKRCLNVVVYDIPPHANDS
ncbi:hypothetical protein QYM36_003215 [Artemia franciscana]|uniref:Uncharacterized protein n=1 Tax=Artemia franciscana TaxID=6661 RepID=A0AA88I6U6_ARTSF|nr:hypothetical protein QYM36_003215 [Artemia franciscana]